MKQKYVVCFTDLQIKWDYPFVLRSQEQLDRFSGGLLDVQSMEKHDLEGTGPKRALMIDGKVAYRTDELARWMSNNADYLDK